MKTKKTPEKSRKIQGSSPRKRLKGGSFPPWARREAVDPSGPVPGGSTRNSTDPPWRRVWRVLGLPRGKTFAIWSKKVGTFVNHHVLIGQLWKII